MDIIRECQGAKTIGITGHRKPDGDCVGACLSLRLYLKKCFPEAEVTVFLDKPAEIFSELEGFEEIVCDYPEREPFDVFIAVDCEPKEDRIGAAVKYFASAVKKINIDHHLSNDGSLGLSLVRPEIGSVCEVLYDLMEKDKIDLEIAKALYLGIVHDTGVFQYSNTTGDTLVKAAHLIGFGFDFPGMVQRTFYQKNFAQTRVMGKALDECRLFMDGKTAVGAVILKTMEEYGVNAKDLDGIVSQIRNITGVCCAVFFYETEENKYKVSLRSDEHVDVSKVASVFGGGGHMRASGCSLEGDLNECTDRLLKVIEQELH